MIDNNLICHNSIKGHPAMPTIIIHWRPTTSLYDDSYIHDQLFIHSVCQ